MNYKIEVGSRGLNKSVCLVLFSPIHYYQCIPMLVVIVAIYLGSQQKCKWRIPLFCCYIKIRWLQFFWKQELLYLHGPSTVYIVIQTNVNGAYPQSLTFHFENISTANCTDSQQRTSVLHPPPIICYYLKNCIASSEGWLKQGEKLIQLSERWQGATHGLSLWVSGLHGSSYSWTQNNPLFHTSCS